MPAGQRGPEWDARHSRTSAAARCDVSISLPTIAISIPAWPGAGKLPVAGIDTQMPVSTPQGHMDNSAVASPGPTVDSCSVGKSESTAYIKGLVEGIDVTVLIDFRGAQNVYPSFT